MQTYFSFMHSDGIFLKLHGAIIPNNSLVDIDDLLYTGSCCEEPSNARPNLHDQALLCVTDLEDCCESPRTVHGDWHYPDGRTVQYDVWGSTFRRNRGANEVRDGHQFYGSVRLYRRYNRPPERGRFRCELPNAADPSVNQTLYANICEFIGLPTTKCCMYLCLFNCLQWILDFLCQYPSLLLAPKQLGKATH